MGVWGEIKQRRITQIVVTYLATGWMALAVVDQFVDRNVLPVVVYSVSLTLYAFGFFGALIIGWYHGEKGVQRAPLAEIMALVILAVGGIGFSALLVRRSLTADTLAAALAESGADLRRIAVLYFEDASSDGSGAATADGITEGLIRRLSQVPELEITSPNGAERVRESGLPADSVARILGAGILVDGAVHPVGSDVRVNVRILEGATGLPVFRQSYTWNASELANVSDLLATELAEELRTRVGTEIRLRETRASAPSSAAWLRVARAERALKDASDALALGNIDAASGAFAAADGELEAAAAESRSWPEPHVLRGRVAYERHWLAHSVEEAAADLDRARQHAEAALSMEPNNAAALELRGTVDYRTWLLRTDHDEAALTARLASARGDLESSRDLDPRRASAFSTLSHLYYQEGQLEEAVLAARQAYRQDAFLSVADEVLWRLYSASYDLADYRQASEWCAEGRRRFSENYRFTECRLWLLTMPGATPSVDEAWALLGELTSRLPEAGRETLEAGAAMAVGGVIGRAGLADSAQAVWQRARLSPAEDPAGELLSIEAAMRSVAGDTEGAVELLRRYTVANPGHFSLGGRLHWWWQGLVGNGDFERLRALN